MMLVLRFDSEDYRNEPLCSYNSSNTCADNDGIENIFI